MAQSLAGLIYFLTAYLNYISNLDARNLQGIKQKLKQKKKQKETAHRYLQQYGDYQGEGGWGREKEVWGG